MDGYTVEQRRTFGRVISYMESKGITDKTWMDVAINSDGTFDGWPSFFPQDEGPSDVEATESDDTAEEIAQLNGLESALKRPRSAELVLLRCLLEELIPTRRAAVLRKAARILHNRS